MRQVHKFEVYFPADEAIQDFAFEYRKAHGTAPEFGMRSDNLYRAWKRLGMPPVTGGGDVPVGFTTLTFGGPARLVIDDQVGEHEFSADVPDVVDKP